MRRLDVPNPNSHQTSALRLEHDLDNKELNNYAAHTLNGLKELARGLLIHFQSRSADAVFRLQRSAYTHTVFVESLTLWAASHLLRDLLRKTTRPSCLLLWRESNRPRRLKTNEWPP